MDGIELDVKIKIGALDGPAIPHVPGFPTPSPLPGQAAEPGGKAPALPAAEPRKPFGDYVAEKNAVPAASGAQRQAGCP